jgi:hydrogenase-1 operon protein HyaE
MTHPLVSRLSDEFGWISLESNNDLIEFTSRPGVHVAFVPGDAERNLETPDLAVILPEIKQAFQGKFDCAVVGDSIETAVREETGVLKTPSLIFYRDGEFLAGIPRVRDWDEYMSRITQILAQPAAA